jgi:hypothetical protein
MSDSLFLLLWIVALNVSALGLCEAARAFFGRVRR